MSRQKYAPRRNHGTRSSSNTTLVRDILLAFTTLGVTAALLAPLPALGENIAQTLAESDAQNSGIENVALPPADQLSGDQALADENSRVEVADDKVADDESVNETTPADSNDAASEKTDDASATNTPETNKMPADEAKPSSSGTLDDEKADNTGKSEEATNNIEVIASTKDQKSDAKSDEKASVSEAHISTEANKASADEATASEDATKSDAKSETATADTPETAGVYVSDLPGLGPEAPFYTDVFATRSGDDALPEYTVILQPNGGFGSPMALTTTTGNVTLPTVEEAGFTPPAGALFVGWSTSRDGHSNVYSGEVMYPDNANHTAVLQGNTTLYAVWLQPGSAADRDTAYYFIRADGLIPFEPSSYSTSLYIPSGSNPALLGELNWGMSITNNLEAVAANLYSQPTDEDIQAAMERQGKTYDPATQEVVWYVVKNRGHKAWNVDGIIMDKVDHLVSYNPNGGDANVPAAQAYKSEANVEVAFDRTPGRPGYTFLGWDESPHATTPTYTASGAKNFTMPNNPITLYAIWEKSTVELTYVSGATEAGSVSHDFDEVYAVDGRPVSEGSLQGSTATANEGYLFQGWYKGDNAGTDVLVTDDETLTAETAVLSANHTHGVLMPTVYVARFEKIHPAFTLAKAVQNEPANGNFFAAGETVTYEVTATNTGNVPLESITFKDNLAEVPSIDSLAVGETKTVSYTYVVTEENVKADVLANTVEATATASNDPDATITADPATANVFVGTLSPDETYVMFAAYPPDEGSVGQSYNIVNTTTGEGIEENTAIAKTDYVFDGWYKENDDTLVTSSPTLTVEDIKEHMNHGKGRTPYGPTIFIAHFTPVSSGGDTPGGGDSGSTDKPTTPDTPTTPDKPTNPDTPDTPDVPSTPDKPDTPTTPDTPSTPDKPSSGDSGSTSGSGSGNTGGSGSGNMTKPNTPATPSNPSKPTNPTNPGNAPDNSNASSGTTSTPGSNGSSTTTQTPSNELGGNGNKPDNLSPTTPAGITPTDVPASSIKAEGVDANTKLAQTDDYALKVALMVTIGGAVVSALALVGICFVRKRKD